MHKYLCFLFLNVRDRQPQLARAVRRKGDKLTEVMSLIWIINYERLNWLSEQLFCAFSVENSSLTTRLPFALLFVVVVALQNVLDRIHQHPRRNAIAPRDQIQGIQISAELKN